MYRSLIVVDDFYPEPQKVREAALNATYPDPESDKYPGRNSKEKFQVRGLDEAVQRIFGEPIQSHPHPDGPHLRFRMTLAGETGRNIAHVDPVPPLVAVGIVYLTLPEHCRGGTAFYAHRDIEMDTVPSPEHLQERTGCSDVKSLLQKDGQDPDKWEHLMTVPMRFNRAVLYRPWMWHSAGEPFGDSIENGRLIHVLNFVPEQPGSEGQSGR